MHKLKLTLVAALSALALSACTSLPQPARQLHPALPALGLQPRQPNFCQRLLTEFTKSGETQTTLCATSTAASPDTTPPATDSTVTPRNLGQ